MYRFGNNVEPDFDAIDSLMTRPTTGRVDFIGDGVIANGKSCFHRDPTPQKMTVTFNDNVTEIERSITYASFEEDMNANTDHTNSPYINDNDNRSMKLKFSVPSPQEYADIFNSNKAIIKQSSLEILRNSKNKGFSALNIDNGIPKSNKFIKKQDSVEVYRNSNIKSNSEDRDSIKEFSTQRPKVYKSKRNIMKQSSVEILRTPNIKKYTSSNSYTSIEECSDDENMDDEHRRESYFAKQKEGRRGSLASAISYVSDTAEGRRGSIASIANGVSATGAGCFSVLVSHLFIKRFY